MGASWGDPDWGAWEGELKASGNDVRPYDWSADPESGLTDTEASGNWFRGFMYLLGLEGAVAILCLVFVVGLWVRG
jgi:hypothetical protein